MERHSENRDVRPKERIEKEQGDGEQLAVQVYLLSTFMLLDNV